MEEAVLLFGGARNREDLGVARVGRLAAERIRREERGPEDLVHQPELQLAEALAAELGVEVCGPQPALLDPLLQRSVDPVEPGLIELAHDRLQGPDLLAHELAHPVELLLKLRLRREIPRHHSPPIKAPFESNEYKANALAVKALATIPYMSRVADTRDRLIAAAEELFAANGI